MNELKPNVISTKECVLLLKKKIKQDLDAGNLKDTLIIELNSIIDIAIADALLEPDFLNKHELTNIIRCAGRIRYYVALLMYEEPLNPETKAKLEEELKQTIVA